LVAVSHYERELFSNLEGTQKFFFDTIDEKVYVFL